MIDKAKLIAGMALLAGAFGREVDGAVIGMYFDTLSPALSTEEFEHAVEIAVAKETYWPSPAVLLEYGKPRARAARALAAVSDDLREHGGFKFYPHGRFLELPAEVKAGIRAIGGLRALTLAEVQDMPRLERKFADAYEEARMLAHAAHVRRLPPSPELQA